MTRTAPAALISGSMHELLDRRIAYTLSISKRVKKNRANERRLIWYFPASQCAVLLRSTTYAPASAVSSSDKHTIDPPEASPSKTPGGDMDIPRWIRYAA